MDINSPTPTDEKFALYSRYLAGWHNRPEPHGRSEFEQFLYESPVDTIEISYRDESGALLAVGICDQSPRSLSSVYFYFEPSQAGRSLGTFGALYELNIAGKFEIPYYYLGYWVAACQAMRYKSSFQPNEVLGSDGIWRALVDSDV